MRHRLLAIVCLGLPLLLVACWSPQPPSASMAQIEYQAMAGDPQRGGVLLEEYGCISCHTVAGINDYNARVGPPLLDWADRRYIVGHLENTPANLKMWVRFPQQISPGSAMPDLDVTDADADDIVAYLFTLGESYDPLR